MRTIPKKLRITSLVPILGVPLLIASACGTDAPTTPVGHTGGAPTGTTGGAPTAGGAPGTVTGGAPTTGTGGAPSTTTGGAPTTGGMSTGLGGSGPTGGMPSVTTGGVPGGGASTGGATGGTPAGGSSQGGSAGSTAKGGAGGAATGGAAAATGGAATGGSGGAATGGATGDLKDLAKDFHGFVILLPCQGGTGEVCQTNKAGEGCPTNADLFKDGVSTTNTTLKMGGTAGTQYTVTMRFQGMVENRVYTGASAPDGDQGSALTQGYFVGGQPQTGVGDYNIYAIRASTPKKDYFLNSIGGTNLQHHRTYPIDYEGSIKVEGGSNVQMLAQDTNCSAIRNCTDPPDNNACTTTGVPNLDPLIAGKVGGGVGANYNGQFVGMLVMKVTSP